MVSDRPQIVYTPEELTYPDAKEETAPPPCKFLTPSPDRTCLATVEEWLLRLQAEFTQLAPDLLNTTTGLYQLKGSVGKIKRKLRVCQTKHRLPNP